MRNIKFRAWDIKEKKWIKLWTFHFHYDGGLNFITDSTAMNNIYNNRNEDRYILIQYTGLKDKNGKEIYEGDIVKMLSRTFTQVYFSDGGFCVNVGGQLVGLHPDFLGRYRTVEVIGNIYEHPELLDKAQKK